jgi:hypothetical protein
MEALDGAMKANSGTMGTSFRGSWSLIMEQWMHMELWKLPLEPWRFALEPWRIILELWRYTLEPWRLALATGRLSLEQEGNLQSNATF